MDAHRVELSEIQPSELPQMIELAKKSYAEQKKNKMIGMLTKNTPDFFGRSRNRTVPERASGTSEESMYYENIWAMHDAVRTCSAMPSLQSKNPESRGANSSARIEGAK